jgi:hypothetical protein
LCRAWGRTRKEERKRTERKEKKKRKKMEIFLNLEILGRKIKDNLWTLYKNNR